MILIQIKNSFHGFLFVYRDPNFVIVYRNSKIVIASSILEKPGKSLYAIHVGKYIIQ